VSELEFATDSASVASQIFDSATDCQKVSAIKNPLLIITAVAVAVALGFILFANNIDGVIAKEIETQGSEALGSTVRVAKVDTDIANGSAIVSGLTVANPERFEADYAVEIASFSATVDYANRTINEIIIDQPIINIELIDGTSNFQELSENLSDDDSNSDEADESNISIDVLRLSGAQVNLVALGTDIEQQSFVMDDLVIRKLNGTSDQIANEISLELVSHVTAQLRSYLAKRFKNRVIEGLEEKAGELTNKLRDRLRDSLRPERPTEEP
jgi:hypothetical protein